MFHKLLKIVIFFLECIISITCVETKHYKVFIDGGSRYCGNMFYGSGGFIIMDSSQNEENRLILDRPVYGSSLFFMKTSGSLECEFLALIEMLMFLRRKDEIFKLSTIDIFCDSLNIVSSINNPTSEFQDSNLMYRYKTALSLLNSLNPIPKIFHLSRTLNTRSDWLANFALITQKSWQSTLQIHASSKCLNLCCIDTQEQLNSLSFDKLSMNENYEGIFYFCLDIEKKNRELLHCFELEVLIDDRYYRFDLPKFRKIESKSSTGWHNTYAIDIMELSKDICFMFQQKSLIHSARNVISKFSIVDYSQFSCVKLKDFEICGNGINWTKILVHVNSSCFHSSESQTTFPSIPIQCCLFSYCNKNHSSSLHSMIRLIHNNFDLSEGRAEFMVCSSYNNFRSIIFTYLFFICS
jgi:hypothetical protein